MLDDPFDVFISINLYSPSTDDTVATESTRSISRRQIQSEFLQIINKSQSDCTHNKVIFLELFGDDFGEIHHFVGSALLTAVASGRRLHIIHPDDRWKSLYQPLTTCHIPKEINTTFEYPIHPEFSLYRYYVASRENVTYFNEVIWNEILSRQSKADWFTGVFRSEWFGKFGNVFIRSFIQYHIWFNLIDHALISKRKYRPQITAYRTSNGSEYSLNDYLNVIRDAVNISEFDCKLITADTHQSALDVIGDVEQLRTSDYIIGSGKDELFRLGMELQFATNWFDGGYGSPQRAFTVDIAWIQDP